MRFAGSPGRVAALTLGVGLVGACGAEAPAPEWTEVDSAGVRIVTSQRPVQEWNLAPEPELALGGGGGATDFFLVRSAAFLDGDRFAVANAGTEEIRIFDMSGALLGAVGREGNGPEEFTGLSRIAPLGDSLLGYDERNDRLSVRDAEGRYARSFRLEWFAGLLVPVELLGDRTLLAITARAMSELPGAGLIHDSALVSTYDLEGSLVDSIARFPYMERMVRREGNRQTTLGQAFSATGSFARQARGFCYVFGVVAELRCFDSGGALESIARIAVDPRPVRPEDIDWFWEHELETSHELRVNALRRMRTTMVFPGAFPAFEDLRVDDRGRIWAATYPTPDAAFREWQVFDDRGGWVGRLTGDPAFRVMAISGDRVLGVWLDELGVEQVRMYRLGPG